jgi:hypothetical protein
MEGVSLTGISIPETRAPPDPSSLRSDNIASQTQTPIRQDSVYVVMSDKKNSQEKILVYGNSK